MYRAAVFLLVLLLVGLPVVKAGSIPSVASAFSRDQNHDPNQDQDQAPSPNYQQDANYQPYSPEQLDNLLSPIALYPDPLLAQVLIATTFPDQVEEAARWVRGNGQSGIDEQNWDVSVKAVAHYPTVVEMMADKIDWTTSVGQAYVNQSTDVSTAVQRLRHMARRVGNLVTTPQWEVIENGEYIAIDPIQPQYIYVPVYDPAICYYRRPYWGPAIAFGVGYPIGGWLNLDFHWGFGGGWGGVFYTGWRPWGGWNGGWVERCRPYVRPNNFYVSDRYRNINVNRGVINRSVNVTNINHYNSIHNNVTYNNVTVNNNRVSNYNAGHGNIQVNNNSRVNNTRVNNIQNNVNSNVQNNRGSTGNNSINNSVNNKVLNRNIDVNNSRVNQFRGNTTINQNNHPTQIQNNVHTFGHSEGNFNANVSSQRGQYSRTQMSQPVHTYTPASRGGGGGGGGGGHPSGGGGHPSGGRHQ
jgi:hypothetical protein